MGLLAYAWTLIVLFLLVFVVLNFLILNEFRKEARGFQTAFSPWTQGAACRSGGISESPFGGLNSTSTAAVTTGFVQNASIRALRASQKGSVAPTPPSRWNGHTVDPSRFGGSGAASLRSMDFLLDKAAPADAGDAGPNHHNTTSSMICEVYEGKSDQESDLRWISDAFVLDSTASDAAADSTKYAVRLQLPHDLFESNQCGTLLVRDARSGSIVGRADLRF